MGSSSDLIFIFAVLILVIRRIGCERLSAGILDLGVDTAVASTTSAAVPAGMLVNLKRKLYEYCHRVLKDLSPGDQTVSS